MLADVGLSRADALAAGNQPSWRDPRKWLAARAEERQAMQERVHESEQQNRHLPAHGQGATAPMR
jgi:hypothetical protein